MGVDAILEIVRLGLGGAFVAVGLVFLLGGAVGLLRFPDIYTRIHGATTANPLGAVIIVTGLAIAAPSLAMAAKLLLLALLAGRDRAALVARVCECGACGRARAGDG